MKLRRILAQSGLALLVGLGIGVPHGRALDATTRCQAAKLVESGKLRLCFAKAEARAAKKGGAADLARCDQSFADRWAKIEAKGACASAGDRETVAEDLHRHARELATRLAPGGSNPDDNLVLMELSGVFTGDVVMLSGPGVDFERVPGFDALGRPSDQPGAITHRAVTFEYEGPAEPALASFLADSLDPRINDRRAASLVVPYAFFPLPFGEAFRWNLYELALTSITPGPSGKNRYRLEHLPPFPSPGMHFERLGASPAEDSRNPATDAAIEIEGVSTGRFPAVSVDEKKRTITLSFDHVEGGGALDWVRAQANGLAQPRALSLIDEVNGVETGRTNYYGITQPVRNGPSGRERA